MTGTKSTALPQRTGSSDVTVIGRIKSLLFGGVIGSVSGLLLISVFAIIFAYSSLPDTAIDLFSYGAVAFAAFI